MIRTMKTKAAVRRAPFRNRHERGGAPSQILLVWVCITALLALAGHQPFTPSIHASTGGNSDCLGGVSAGAPCPGTDTSDDCECSGSGTVSAFLSGSVDPAPAVLTEQVTEQVTAPLSGSGSPPSTTGDCDLTDVCWSWSIVDVQYRLEAEDSWESSSYSPTVDHPDNSSPDADLIATPSDPGYWKVKLELEAVWDGLTDCPGTDQLEVEFVVVSGIVQGEQADPSTVAVFANTRCAAEVVVFPSAYASSCKLVAEGTALTFSGGATEYKSLSTSPQLVDVVGTSGEGEVSGTVQLVLVRSGGSATASASASSFSSSSGFESFDGGGGASGEEVLDDAATKKFDHGEWVKNMWEKGVEWVIEDGAIDPATDWIMENLDDQFDFENQKSFYNLAVAAGNTDAIEEARQLTYDWNNAFSTTKGETKTYIQNGLKGIFSGTTHANSIFGKNLAPGGYAAGEVFPAETKKSSLKLKFDFDADFKELILDKIPAGDDIDEIRDYMLTPGAFVSGINLLELTHEYADGQGTQFSIKQTTDLSWKETDAAGKPGKWEEPAVEFGIEAEYRLLNFEFFNVPARLKIKGKTGVNWSTDSGDVGVGDSSIKLDLELDLVESP